MPPTLSDLSALFETAQRRWARAAVLLVRGRDQEAAQVLAQAVAEYLPIAARIDDDDDAGYELRQLLERRLFGGICLRGGRATAVPVSMLPTGWCLYIPDGSGAGVAVMNAGDLAEHGSFGLQPLWDASRLAERMCWVRYDRQLLDWSDEVANMVGGHSPRGAIHDLLEQVRRADPDHLALIEMEMADQRAGGSFDDAAWREHLAAQGPAAAGRPDALDDLL